VANETREFRPRERRGGNALEPFTLSGPLAAIVERGKAEIAKPFKGITTDGAIIPDLFKVAKTGVPLQPVVDAANAFLACLSPEQRAGAIFDLDTGPWRNWHNMHPFIMRHGCLLETLTAEQRERTLDIVRASMSAAGFAIARDVMKLNEHIGEITGRPAEYGEWYYWMSIMGTPSSTEPWGWQIDGHHLIVNCFVMGDQMVLTPNFMGSEPVEAKFGKYKGTRVFKAEEEKGYGLMSAFTAEQRQKATIGMKLPFDVFATAGGDNATLPEQGLAYGEMTGEQRDRLMDLIALYIGRIRPGHAEIRLDEVKRHIEATRFAWIGQCDEVNPFYYRVHNPVVLIEFDHQIGIALDNDEPTRNHTHTLVRTPNGNDYGKDLLRQHYRQFDHTRPDSPHRQGKV
jgi:hypothetical protein